MIAVIIALVALFALAVLDCWLWAKSISDTRGRDED